MFNYEGLATKALSHKGYFIILSMPVLFRDT